MGKLIIISNSDEPFLNRAEAGRLLARELERYRGGNTLVLGIPGGGVVVGEELASQLDADFDIILSRKIGAPGQAELALGAVAEDGGVFLNRDILDHIAVDELYLSEERERQSEEIESRKKIYRHIKAAEKYEGRDVILTDDGVATGATMEAALWTVRKGRPRKLIAALPVGPRDSLERLSKSADETICLRVPELFYAVGQFYRDFEQIGPEEILHILKKAAAVPKKQKGGAHLEEK